jgi:ubiquitin-protein ligase/ribosomal protein S27E
VHPAKIERRKQDLAKLEALAHTSNGKIHIGQVSGPQWSSVEIVLLYKTAPSHRYPEQTRAETRVKFELSSAYPAQEPVVTMLDPIFHPNVYASGKVCLGTKWLQTEGLDLLLKRIIKLITFDETILNELSPANTSALEWYRQAKRRHPNAFPTDNPGTTVPPPQRTMSWTNIENSENPAPSRVHVACSHCGKRHRVPSGRAGNVKCRQCGKKFEVEC